MKTTAFILTIFAILGAVTIAVQTNVPHKVQLYTYISIVTDVPGTTVQIVGNPPVTMKRGATYLHYPVNNAQPMMLCNGKVFTCYDDNCKTPSKAECPIDVKFWRVQPDGWSPIGYDWPDEDL